MRLVEIHRTERALVAVSVFYSLALALPRAFTLTVAVTVFLSSSGSEALPWAYASGAFVVAVLGLIYVRQHRRIGLRWVSVATFLGFIAVYTLAGLALHAGVCVQAVAFILVVLTEAEFTLTNLSFWNFANQVFTVRQASRLFGFVSAGQNLPAILGGLAIPWLVERVPIEALLVGSLAGHGVAAAWIGWVVPKMLPRAFAQTNGFSESLEGHEGGQPRCATEEAGTRPLSVLRNPYLQWVTALLCAQVFVFFAVDNVFYHVLESRLGAGPELAAFLGRFMVALGVLGLAFRLGLSGRLRRWFSLRSALVSTPAVAMMLASIALTLIMFGSRSEVVFGLVVVLKLWERIAVDAVHCPSYYSLFLPLPLHLRASAQSTLEGVIAQVATLATSVVLIGTHRMAFGVLEALLVLVVVAGAVWIATVLGTVSRYRRALYTALESRRVESDVLPFADTATLDLILEGTRSPAPQQVLRSLAILEELNSGRLGEAALNGLHHPDRRVVLAAANILRRHPVSACASDILERLGSGMPTEIEAALLRAYGACAGVSSSPILQTKLGGAPALRAAAAETLIRYGGQRGRSSGLSATFEMVDAESADVRVLGAQILGELDVNPPIAARLKRLLSDADPVVARSAAEAIASCGGGFGLESALLDAVDRPGLAVACTRSLGRLNSDVALRAIELRFARRRGQRCVLVDDLLLRVVAETPDPSGDALLWDCCTVPHLRHAALLGLSERRSPIDRTALLHLLDEELSLGTELRLAEYDAQDPRTPPSTLVRRALRDELAVVRERLLLVAELAFDRSAIAEARRHLATGSLETADLALELVEAAVPENIAVRLLPLLDANVDACLARMVKGGSLPPRDWPRRRRAIAARGAALPWLSAAMRAGSEEEMADPHIEALEAVARVPMFNLLRFDHLELLARHAAIDTLSEGQTVLGAGEDAIAISLDDESASRLDVLSLLGHPSATTPLVTDTEQRWLRIRRRDLNELFEDAPDAAWSVLRQLCRFAGAQERSMYGSATKAEWQPELPYPELLRLMGELESIPELSEVSSRTLAAVAKSSQERRYASGSVMIAEGRVESTLMILVSGRASVSKEGNFVAEVSAPSVIGEIAAIASAPRSASVTARDDCRALILPREALYALLFEERAVLDLMLNLVATRLRAAAA